MWPFFCPDQKSLNILLNFFFKYPTSLVNNLSGIKMQKLIILMVVVLASFGVVAKEMAAKDLETAMMLDYVPVPDREFAYEVKTREFDKVILDCGGFVGWMSFYRDGKIAHNVYLDTYSDCPNMHEFLSDSKEKKAPVCLMVEDKELTVSNEPGDCQ